MKYNTVCILITIIFLNYIAKASVGSNIDNEYLQYIKAGLYYQNEGSYGLAEEQFQNIIKLDNKEYRYLGYTIIASHYTLWEKWDNALDSHRNAIHLLRNSNLTNTDLYLGHRYISIAEIYEYTGAYNNQLLALKYYLLGIAHVYKYGINLTSYDSFSLATKKITNILKCSLFNSFGKAIFKKESAADAILIH